jgi:hypothetical protein
MLTPTTVFYNNNTFFRNLKAQRPGKSDDGDDFDGADSQHLTEKKNGIPGLSSCFHRLIILLSQTDVLI